MPERCLTTASCVPVADSCCLFIFCHCVHLQSPLLSPLPSPQLPTQPSPLLSPPLVPPTRPCPVTSQPPVPTRPPQSPQPLVTRPLQRHQALLATRPHPKSPWEQEMRLQLSSLLPQVPMQLRLSLLQVLTMPPHPQLLPHLPLQRPLHQHRGAAPAALQLVRSPLVLLRSPSCCCKQAGDASCVFASACVCRLFWVTPHEHACACCTRVCWQSALQCVAASAVRLVCARVCERAKLSQRNEDAACHKLFAGSVDRRNSHEPFSCALVPTWAPVASLKLLTCWHALRRHHVCWVRLASSPGHIFAWSCLADMLWLE